MFPRSFLLSETFLCAILVGRVTRCALPPSLPEDITYARSLDFDPTTAQNLKVHPKCDGSLRLWPAADQTDRGGRGRSKRVCALGHATKTVLGGGFFGILGGQERAWMPLARDLLRIRARNPLPESGAKMCVQSPPSASVASILSESFEMYDSGEINLCKV